MNRQTQVKNMKVRREGALLSEEAPRTGAELTELPPRDGWGKRLLRADKLVRNLAVVGAMLMTVVAVKNAGSPDAQSVFGALQASTEMEWDESLGKLSFVSGILPDGIQAVWSEKETITVFEPMAGDTVHAWSQSEPYMAFMSTVRDVRAVADGEVMSVAHGLEEERILRVRHDDETESIYGNLLTCYAQEGDRVYAGDVIATTIEGKPLVFELRRDGRSIDPEGLIKPIPE